MTLLKSLQLKNSFTSFFFGISLLTVVVFAVSLFQQFDAGLEESAKFRLLSEFNAFSRAYEKDLNTSLPASYVIHFSFDKPPIVDSQGADMLEDVSLENGEFKFIFNNEEVEELSDTDFFLVLYRQTLHNERVLYALARYDYALIGEHFEDLDDQQIKFIFKIMSTYLVLTILVVWFYSYRIGKRTEQLVHWSEAISAEYDEKEVPNFKFNEFNRIADCLKKSLKKNAKLMAREKEFLSHASHELRTPIAIIRANMDILGKMDESAPLKVPLARVKRANTNMQLITETLLWLARQSENQPIESLVSLPLLLDQLIEDQQYLIQGEEVTVITAYGNAPSLVLASTPVMIVLNNLIRNAFQYTHCGWIKISYLDESVVIENMDSDQIDDQNVVSFGFGLELTEKVCCKLGWKLDIQHKEGGVVAKLKLPMRVS